MSAPDMLTTARLQLRRWRPDDLPIFAALNADPKTMRYFPFPLTTEASDALVERQQRLLETEGLGMWAVELVGEAAFIGSVGLQRATFEASFTPATEIGWRLDRRHWGRGYATEAALAALAYGFGELGETEIVSFTSAVNDPSRAVMERLGMHHDPVDDFVFPGFPPDHWLGPHVLYRMSHEHWHEGHRASGTPS